MTKNLSFAAPTAVMLALGLALVAPPAAADHAVDRLPGETTTTYTNPVSADFAGGVWTFPAGSDIRVGLISHGGAGATASFDYLRFYQD